jgi:hypothetical protein
MRGLRSSGLQRPPRTGGQSAATSTIELFRADPDRADVVAADIAAAAPIAAGDSRWRRRAPRQPGTAANGRVAAIATTTEAPWFGRTAVRWNGSHALRRARRTVRGSHGPTWRD